MGDVRAAFWSKAAVGGEADCWPWQAAMFRNGYGQFRRRASRTALAHRVAYELTCGPIPEGLHIDHLCRNPRCVNPRHMEPVTPAENARRAHARSIPATRARFAAMTAWKCGHPRVPENTIRNGGHGACRECNRQRCRASYRAR